MLKPIPKKAVFLIRTPLQLINAIEAKYKLKIKDEESVLILFTDFTPSYQQISPLLNIIKWARIYKLFNIFNRKDSIRSLINKIYGFIKIKLLTFRIKGTQLLLIGNYEDAWIRYTAQKLFISSASIILLEDGLSTLKIAENRIKSKKIIPNRINKENKKKLLSANSIDNFLLGNQSFEIPKLTFFTTYTRIPLNEYDELIPNNYLWLSTIKSTQIKTNEIWFIGQPLLDQKNIDAIFLKRVLAAIKNKWGSNYKFYYIKHRSEKLINEVLDSDFVVLTFQNPIEIEVLRRFFIPSAIISFFSSALINFSRLYSPQEIEIFYTYSIKERLFQKQDIIRIIKYFKDEKSLVKLDINL